MYKNNRFYKETRDDQVCLNKDEHFGLSLRTILFMFLTFYNID